jgi:hypothetical protein
MAAVLKNMSGKTWGLTAETWGIAVKSFRQKADSDVFLHKDHQGEVDGKVFYNFKVTGSVSGATTATSNENIGDAITLANQEASLGGVTGGTTLVQSVEISKENESVQEVTIEFERYPTLTVTP